MAEMMRKFFEMNDTDVLIVAFLYFTGVTIGGIYCIRKWREEDDEKRQGGSDHRHGRQARR